MNQSHSNHVVPFFFWPCHVGYHCFLEFSFWSVLDVSDSKFVWWEEHSPIAILKDVYVCVYVHVYVCVSLCPCTHTYMCLENWVLIFIILKFNSPFESIHYVPKGIPVYSRIQLYWLAHMISAMRGAKMRILWSIPQKALKNLLFSHRMFSVRGAGSGEG